MTHDVYIKSGEQPRAFSWGDATNPLPAALVAAGAQASLPIYKESPYSTFQAILEGTGAVTATVLVEVSNDNETGAGVVLNTNAPGALVLTASGSPTMTSEGKQFCASLVGTVVSAPGVPTGTTVSAVAATGATLTLSANATATSASPGVQANFRKINWCATPLGTITLSGTTNVSDGIASAAPWRWVRLRVTAITGTGAALRGLMGV